MQARSLHQPQLHSMFQRPELSPRVWKPHGWFQRRPKLTDLLGSRHHLRLLPLLRRREPLMLKSAMVSMKMIGFATRRMEMMRVLLI